MVDGERSYVRARAGKPIESPAVAVTVHRLDVVAYEASVARLRVRCSAGFYVRSLAHDLGQRLGTGAYLEGLVRTEAAGFRSDDALPFETVVRAPRAELRERIRPLGELLTDVPAVELTAEGVNWARHGRDLGPRQLVRPFPTAPTLTRLLGPDGRLVGLADRSKMPGFLHPTVVFS
jgi:tRNA pseudouridine55 synthase